MELENFENWYNNEAIELWKKFGGAQVLVPHLLPKIQINPDVLFIGMNPSHRLDWIQKVLESNKQDFNSYGVDELFSYPGESLAKRLPYITLMEEYARDNVQYYRVLDDLVSKCGYKSWTHLDLFLNRETEQGKFLKIIEYNESNNYFNEFGLEQLNLFKKAFNKLKPKIVVVNNATASVIISQLFTGEGVTKTCIKYQNVTIFLGGMLSGQRAMDRFSKLRLINEIKLIS